MKCKTPVLIIIDQIKTKDKISNLQNEWDKDIRLVACGKCPECQRKRTLEWTHRIQHEYETSNWNGYFITLTYDEPYLPKKGVNKEDVQKYMKRIRHFKKDNKIKYFFSAEYGEQLGRPHYHGIILGLDNNSKYLVDTCWNMGFTLCKPVNYANIKYVVDYLFKTIPEEVQKDIDNKNLNQPFTLKSKGIGLNYAKKYIHEISKEKAISVQKYKLSIPRYYLKKMKDKTIENGDAYYEHITQDNKGKKYKDIIKKEEIDLSEMTKKDIRKLIEEEYWNENRYAHIIAHNQQIESRKKLKK